MYSYCFCNYENKTIKIKDLLTINYQKLSNQNLELFLPIENFQCSCLLQKGRIINGEYFANTLEPFNEFKKKKVAFISFPYPWSWKLNSSLIFSTDIQIYIREKNPGKTSHFLYLPNFVSFLCNFTVEFKGTQVSTLPLALLLKIHNHKMVYQ